MYEWLKAEREHYAALTEKLEHTHLTVSSQRMDEITKQTHNPERNSDVVGAPATCPTFFWKELEIEELPSAFCNIFQDFNIEFTCIIDLNREMFIVNNWIYFKLWDIPRVRWVRGFPPRT